jgi:hypothetical protein
MMFAAVVAVLGALVALLLYKRSKAASPEVARDSSPALDRFVRDALEQELAEPVLGIRGSTPEERLELARTLGDEPDADVVGKIEELVRAVELEFVRYAHEGEVETTVRVRYEDGTTGTSTQRLPLADIPEAVRSDFDAKGSTRVFRSWAFPWQRVRAL